MKVPVYNQRAQTVGDVEISSKVFGVKPKAAVLAEVARVQQMNARSAHPGTKTRAAVSGGGKKPWKQKGTGRARVGSIRSPIWRHGGVALGPSSERNWHRDLNKKVKRAALCMALSDKLQNGKLVIVDAINLEAPKTKLMSEILKTFRASDTGLGKKPLLILTGADAGLVRCSRNLPGVTSAAADSLNPLSILEADSLMILKGSLPVIEKTFGKERKVVSSKL